MKNKIRAAVMAVVVSAGLAITATPAQAWSCTVQRPSVRANKTYDLLTTGPRYTGRPFSWIVKWTTAGFPGATYTKYYVLDRGYPRSANIPPPWPRPGKITEVRGWQSGKECARWRGSVSIKR